MNFVNFTKFPPFLKMREKMGVPKDYKSKFKSSLSISMQLKLKQIQTKGLDVSIDEIVVASNNTLEHKDFPGQKTVVYIRDINSYGRETSLPKYHVAWCKTLSEMKNNGKYEKYVVSLRNDGIFTLNKLSGRTILQRDIEIELCVCKNCLTALNYRGYSTAYNKKEEIYNNFSIKNFFEQYNSKIPIEPTHNSSSKPLNTYSENWNKISRDVRAIKKYICQDCGKDFNNNPGQLHVHHIDGDKTNENPSNLEVVCHECHAKKPNHGHMRRTKY